MSGILKIGTEAPEFTLRDQNDRDVRLSEFRGQWVILYFYPEDDTPGCTTEACDFTGGIKPLEKLNAKVLGVSPDSTESHRAFIKKYDLKITLLSDPDHKVIDPYGIWQLKSNFGNDYMGIVRTTYLIDPKGKIAQVWEKVQAAGHVDQVTAKLAEVNK